MNRRAYIMGLVHAGATDTEISEANKYLPGVKGYELRKRYTREDPWHECTKCHSRWQAPGPRTKAWCPDCRAESYGYQLSKLTFDNARFLGRTIIQARRDDVIDLDLLEDEMRSEFGDEFFDAHIKWAFTCPIE